MSGAMRVKTKGLTPKLRFPAYADSGPWSVCKLSSIVDLRKGEQLAAELKDDNAAFKHFNGGITASSRTQLANREANTTIISEGGNSCGHVQFVEEPFWCGGHCYSVHPKAKQDNRYILYSLQAHQDQIMALRVGSGLPNIPKTILEQFELPLSENADEQQKIAACFTSLDQRVAAEERKLQALRAYKNGLMQRLFPSEGEDRPRLRFAQFSDKQAWVAKVGGDLFANRREEGEEGLPIYSVTVNEGMIPRASIDRDFYDIEDPSGNKKARKGDIAYNMMRMWQGAQGVAPEDCMVSPAYVVLAPLKDVCSEFFAYLFKLPQSLALLTAHSRGLTKDRLRLYFDDFKQVPLRVPTFAEQQRIASCVSSVDRLISAQSMKLGGLRAHKKGLMQQLFTGRGAV
jgi:type I restriction enzyme, S subunit